MASRLAAGFVVFRRLSNKIEFLLLQTSYGIHHWTPPKGHVDPGEREIVTAFRETQEESGLSKNDLKIYEDCKRILNYEVKGSPKIVYYWLAELINSDAVVKLSDEHQDFKWLEVQDACNYAEYKDMKNVLMEFYTYITSAR